jgi:hypothetical protein
MAELEMTISAALLAFWIALGSTAAFGQDLQEHARQHGGSANSVIDIDAPVSQPVDLMSRADLVVHGRVTDVTVRLNTDQTQVITQYTIEPIQAFKQRTIDRVSVPGTRTNGIVVQRTGGSFITADGLRLSTSVNIFPEAESFKVGEEVLVFLTYKAETKTYTFTSGEFGTYRIREGMASLMTENAAKRRRDKPMSSSALFADLQRSR